MDEIIKVNDVSMRFNLAQEKTETLKEYTVKLLTHKLFFNEFYALKHVSFSMKRGESLALIGRNGSGKSTMLKVISGVMYPSGGSVAVNGEIAPMIELGAGFDMDLTARENIFLNGAVLGHDRDYMMEHFDRIIEFSELKDFVDVPVKNFSSGMIARLGFSIVVVKVILLTNLKIALGSLLIIPGIYWSYCYMQVGYLMAENPYLTTRRAMELSKQMMDGEKWNTFVLQLSFIGWYLLCSITFGIGFIFLEPYVQATFAELYAALRAKALASGYTNEYELGGFVRH